MKTPKIDPEFKALVPPQSEGEHAELRASLIKTGRATDPIIIWRGLILDGHNRFELCTELGIPYTIAKAEPYPVSRAEARLWIGRAQMHRRHMTRDQRLALAVRLGIEAPAGEPQYRVDHMRLAQERGYINDIVADRLTLRQAMNRINPRPPQGPKGTHTASPPPQVAEGLELRAQTTKVMADGKLDHRYDKTAIARTDNHVFEPVPSEMHPTKITTRVDGDGRTGMQYITAKPDQVARERAMIDAWKRHASLYAGLAGVTEIPTSHQDTLTAYPLGDPHIGMLAWEPETGEHFDLHIACRELLACVRELVNSAPPSRRAIICNLGDFMHAQDDTAKTPGHGNQLDVDGRFAKVLDAGHTLLRGIVDCALTRHEVVHVRNLPGNHDPRVAAELMMWLRAVYESDPRVVVEDAYASHQYDRFGKVLLGWHHGDRSKSSELPAIMSTDRARDWGETEERIWHVGHVHHLTRQETPGCVVETHRTMAARDAWHAGRYRAGRSLNAITYHKAFGEVSRQTVNLTRVRARMNVLRAEGGES